MIIAIACAACAVAGFLFGRYRFNYVTIILANKILHLHGKLEEAKALSIEQRPEVKR